MSVQWILTSRLLYFHHKGIISDRTGAMVFTLPLKASLIPIRNNPLFNIGLELGYNNYLIGSTQLISYSNNFPSVEIRIRTPDGHNRKRKDLKRRKKLPGLVVKTVPLARTKKMMLKKILIVFIAYVVNELKRCTKPNGCLDVLIIFVKAINKLLSRILNSHLFQFKKNENLKRTVFITNGTN